MDLNNYYQSSWLTSMYACLLYWIDSLTVKKKVKMSSLNA